MALRFCNRTWNDTTDRHMLAQFKSNELHIIIKVWLSHLMLLLTIPERHNTHL